MRMAALRDWFDPDELGGCPECGEHAALSLPVSATLVCFACGLVVFPGGVTSVSEIQGREPSLTDDLSPAERGRLAAEKQHGVDLLYRSGDTHHLL